MDSISFIDTVLQMAEKEGFFYWPEFLAVVFGLLYVILAAKENIWCWFWGILSCLLWAFADFAAFNLYVDGVLQIFYVIMGFVGWYQWKLGGRQKEELKISVLSVRQHLQLIGVGVLLTLPTGYFFDNYTSTDFPFLDSLTTIFAIFTTILVIRKKLENWLYWIVIDLIYIYLFFSKGGYLFAGLFVVYVVIAVLGYRNWLGKYERTVEPSDNYRS